MGSKPRIPPPEGPRKTPSTSTSTKRPRNPASRRAATHIDGGATVSNKLQALKSLIPSENAAQINADQLFQETADYIVRLKAQVIVLQQLIDLYGSQPREEHNAA